MGYPDLAGNFLLRVVSCSPHFQRSRYAFARHFNPCPWTSWRINSAPLGAHIRKVFSLSADEQMRWIYASWIVTVMANEHPVRDLNPSKKERNAMGAMCLPPIMEITMT